MSNLPPALAVVYGSPMSPIMVRLHRQQRLLRKQNPVLCEKRGIFCVLSIYFASRDMMDSEFRVSGW